MLLQRKCHWFSLVRNRFLGLPSLTNFHFSGKKSIPLLSEQQHQIWGPASCQSHFWMWRCGRCLRREATLLPVPRGNVGQTGEGVVHTAKISHQLSSSNCRIPSADPPFSWTDVNDKGRMRRKWGRCAHRQTLWEAGMLSTRDYFVNRSDA